MTSLDRAFLQCYGGISVNSLNETLHVNDDYDEQIDVIKHSSYYDTNLLKSTLASKKQCFTVLSSNIESINAKFNELQILIKQLQDTDLHFSAICLQETWLDDNDDTGLIQLDNYECITQGKKCSNKGGLIIYLHKMFKHKTVLSYNNSNIWEGQFIEISGGGLQKNIVIGNVYRPPRDVLENYQAFIKEFTDVIAPYDKSKKELIVAGDTNINLLKINERNIYGEFFDSLTGLSIYPKVTLPTRFSNRNGSLIDNFFCKLSPTVVDALCGVLIDKFSDHQPYFICLNTKRKNIPQPKYITVQKYNQAEIDNTIEEIRNADIMNKMNINENADPNQNYCLLQNTINEIKMKNMPQKQVKFNRHKHKIAPWISNGIVKSISFRDKLYKRLRMTNQDTQEYLTLKTNLHTYNTILKTSIRNAKMKYYQSCFNRYKSDMRKTWGTINNILNKIKSKKKFPEYFIENGQAVKDKITIADKFNLYFTNIGPKLAKQINAAPNKSFRDYLTKNIRTTFQFHNITQTALERIIDHFKSKTSTGHDGLSMKLMKDLKHVLIEPLTIIINQMLNTGIFPDKLKIGRIIPLYKKGDDNLFENYRPISLLPAISKIFEKVIFIQLHTYCKDNNILYQSQYGFREDHSTELAALEVIDRIIQSMDNDDIPLNVYLDLSKAFDTLDHSILLEKLQYYGITGTSLKLFHSYLSNRKQFVDFDGTRSRTLDIETGVPQGSVLGPLLFIIYVNDISEASALFKAINYADDTTLSSTLSIFNIKHKTNYSSDNINLELEKINDWLKLNKLSLNIEKTKFMVFHTPQRKLVMPNIEIDGIQIERVQIFNFLGIVFDEHLNWHNHVAHISTKISRTIGILNKLKYLIPENIKIMLYNSLILSHINYGILAWGYNHERILKLQKRAIRIITLSKYNAHTEPLFKSRKLLKIHNIFQIQQYKFYHKYVNNKLPSYFHSFQLQRNDDIHNHNTRFHTNIHVRRTNHEFAKRCIRQSIISLINSTTDTIKQKVHTHSLQGFSLYIKTTILKNYCEECRIPNCYICLRD